MNVDIKIGDTEIRTGNVVRVYPWVYDEEICMEHQLFFDRKLVATACMDGEGFAQWQDRWYLVGTFEVFLN